MPNFKNQRGIVPLAVLGIGFLVLSLVSVTAATNNPLKKFAVTSWARYSAEALINQRERAAARGQGPACNGAWCLGPEIVKNQGEASNQQGVGQDIINTYNAAVKNGDQAALNTLKSKNELLYGLALADIAKKNSEEGPHKPTAIPGLTMDDVTKLYNFLNTGTASEQEILAICQKVSKNCDPNNLSKFAADELKQSPDFNADALLKTYDQRNGVPHKPTPIAGLTTDDVTKLYNFLNTGTATKQEILAICQKVSTDCASKDLGQFAADELKQSPDFNSTTLLNTYNVRKEQELTPHKPAPIAGLTTDEVTKLYNFLNTGTVPESDILTICRKVVGETDPYKCVSGKLQTFAAMELSLSPNFNAPTLLDTYNKRIASYNLPPHQPTSVPKLSNEDVVKLYNFLNTGTTSDADVVDICKKVGENCTGVDLGQFAADQLKQAPEFNTQVLLDTYNQRKQILQGPTSQLAPVQTVTLTQTNPTAGSYSQRDFCDVPIPNVEGQTLCTWGCGVVAVTNIVDLNGANLDPKKVLDMIPANRWGPGGLSGVRDGEFIKLLTDPNGFNYKAEPYVGLSVNTWNRVGPNQIVWIGAPVSDDKGNKNVQHITFLIPTNEKDVFKLQKNDYFGSDMTCKPGQTGSGDGFNCSNQSGDKLEIPIDGQTVLFLTPPSK